MALNGLFCANVPLRNYSLTHSSQYNNVFSAKNPFRAKFGDLDFCTIWNSCCMLKLSKVIVNTTEPNTSKFPPSANKSWMWLFGLAWTLNFLANLGDMQQTLAPVSKISRIFRLLTRIGIRFLLENSRFISIIGSEVLACPKLGSLSLQHHAFWGGFPPSWIGEIPACGFHPIALLCGGPQFETPPVPRLTPLQERAICPNFWQL